jgi:nicotinate phosphoribosyltransferase
LIDPFDPTRQRVMPTDLPYEDLLTPVVRAGKRVDAQPTLVQMQERTRHELTRFDPAVRRLVNPHEYPVGLSAPLYAERVRLIQEARNAKRRP